MKVGEKYRELKNLLQDASEAQILLAYVLAQNKAQLIAYAERPLTQNEIQAIDHLAALRQAKKPIAYLTGHQAFWALDLKVTPDTLIPRPETECLVEWILTHCKKPNLKVADLGTGCGTIALALAHEKPNWIVHATDASEKALTVAKENAQHYHLTNVSFFHGDWFEALTDHDYDVIVSNPPYIAPNDVHLANLTDEPKTALVSDNNGLRDIFYLIDQAKSYLKPDGLLIIEHGYDQQAKILDHAKGVKVKGCRDLSGNDRFVVISQNDLTTTQ